MLLTTFLLLAAVAGVRSAFEKSWCSYCLYCCRPCCLQVLFAVGFLHGVPAVTDVFGVVVAGIPAVAGVLTTMLASLLLLVSLLLLASLLVWVLLKLVYVHIVNENKLYHRTMQSDWCETLWFSFLSVNSIQIFFQNREVNCSDQDPWNGRTHVILLNCLSFLLVRRKLNYF